MGMRTSGRDNLVLATLATRSFVEDLPRVFTPASPASFTADVKDILVRASQYDRRGVSLMIALSISSCPSTMALTLITARSPWQ